MQICSSTTTWLNQIKRDAMEHEQNGREKCKFKFAKVGQWKWKANDF